MNVLDKELTRSVEAIAENSGFSSSRMMENAGSAAAKIICEKIDIKNKSVIIIAGKGNNGGDGLVVARKLFDAGATVSVLLIHGMPQTPSSKEMLSKLSPYPIRILGESDDEALNIIKTADVIVDAIFGIGFLGLLDDKTAKILECINKASALRVALDLPSGAECDSGRVQSICFNADLTVTFIAVKPCHILYPASDFCGKLIRVGIGLPPKIIDSVSSNITVIDDELVKKSLPKLPKNAHKGSAGRLSLLCGSYGMSGAAYLSAKAALRSGVGLAKLIVPKSIYPILASSLPEAVYSPYGSDDAAESIEDIISAFMGSDAGVIGCGLGKGESAQGALSALLMRGDMPIVLDADGINIISQNIDILLKSKAEIILTPHPAEMARLIGAKVEDIMKNRIKVASIFAQKSKKILILKGANTLVALPNGQLYVCMRGNPGMATAGSGDTLAGIIGALLACGMPPAKAAVCGVQIHAAAGDIAAMEKSVRGMVASDIIDSLPSLFKHYED